MTDVLQRTVNLITRPSWRDLFSYESRTTKRLIRHVVVLYETTRSEINNVVTVELWLACLTPVMQGYWRSAVAERKKKKVFDAFYPSIINIIVNDGIIPSDEFQNADPGAQHALLDKAHADVDQKARARADEYIAAMTEFFDRDVPNNMPKELVHALARNLFPVTPAQTGNPPGGVTDEFVDAMPVAIVMISAFSDFVAG